MRINRDEMYEGEGIPVGDSLGRVGGVVGTRHAQEHFLSSRATSSDPAYMFSLALVSFVRHPLQTMASLSSLIGFLMGPEYEP